MKKFLVLGIGAPQADLIVALKLKGFYVLGCSNTEDGPGRELLDDFCLIDITDYEKVRDYARKELVDYVYSVGSDVAMPTVAWVSHDLGLPAFVSFEVASNCNNKGKFRSLLADAYGSVPFVLVGDTPSTISPLDWPIIVKPVDSQGQRGVALVEGKECLSSAVEEAKSFSRSGEVILERYVAGEEISVNAFFEDGELLFSMPSGRISWEGYGGGLIHKHLVPYNLSDTARENVDRLVSEVASGLDVLNGPLYYQIKIEDDTPSLIEVAARLDGCHMWRLIEQSTGVNLLAATIDCLTGQSVNLSSGQLTSGVLEFFCSAPDKEFRKENFRVADNAVYHEFYYTKGDKVRRMNGHKEKCGYQIYEQ